MPINKDPPFAGTSEVPAVQVTMGKVDLRDRPNTLFRKLSAISDIPTYVFWSYNHSFSPASAADPNTPRVFCTVNTATKNVSWSISSPILSLIFQSYQAGTANAYVKYTNIATGLGIAYAIPANTAINETSEIALPLFEFSTKFNFNLRRTNDSVKISELKLAVESANITTSYVSLQLVGIPSWTTLPSTWTMIQKTAYDETPTSSEIKDNDLSTYKEFSVTSTTETEILRGTFSSPINLIEFATKLETKVSGGTGYIRIYLSKDGGTTWINILSWNFTHTDWRYDGAINWRYFEDGSADKFTHFKITLWNNTSGQTTYVRIYEISAWDYTSAKVSMTTTGTVPADAYDNDFGTGTGISTTSTTYIEIARIDLGTDYYDINNNTRGYAGYMCYKLGGWTAIPPDWCYIKLQRSSDGTNWTDYEEYATNSGSEVIWNRVRNCDWRYLRILQRTSSSTSSAWAKVYEFMVIA